MTCYKPIDAYKSDDLNPETRKPYPYFYSISKIPKGVSYQLVQSKCGRCIGCRLDYSRQWAIRCMHEAQMHEKNCFITLTYDDFNLPLVNGKYPTIVYRDFVLFMKRLRKKFGSNIRVYYAGEYGSKYGRPHFHAIIFNYRPDDLKFWKDNNGFPLYTSEVLSDLWQNKGYVSVGDVTFESAAYVARYIMKKQTGEGAKKYVREEVDPQTGEVVIYRVAEEKANMSRRGGIGYKWIEKNYKHVYSRDSVIVDGKQVRPPLFYDNYVKKVNSVFDSLQYSLDDDHFSMIMDKFNFEFVDFDTIVKKRKEKMLTQKNLDNNSRERLIVRETVKQAQISKLVRVVD